MDSLPSSIRHRLEHLAKNHDSYSYAGDTSVADKTLIAVIAPTAVGKSTLIRHILDASKAQGIDAGEVDTWTTRPGRANDPSNYHTNIPHQSLCDMIDRRELINWSLFPTGHIYASVPGSYPAAFNFLPLMPSSLATLESAGFKAVRAVYLTTDVAAWQEQLSLRGSADIGQRLIEAKESLAFARANRDQLAIVQNKPGTDAIKQLAHQILDAVTADSVIESDAAAIRQLDEMLAYATEHSHGTA